MAQEEVKDTEKRVPDAVEAPETQEDMSEPITPPPPPLKIKRLTRTEWKDISAEISSAVNNSGLGYKPRIIQEFQSDAHIDELKMQIPASTNLEHFSKVLSGKDVCGPFIQEMKIEGMKMSFVYRKRYRVSIKKAEGPHSTLESSLLDFDNAGEIIKQIFSSLHEKLSIKENGLYLNIGTEEAPHDISLSTSFSNILSIIGLETSTYSYSTMTREMFLTYILSSPYANPSLLREISDREESKGFILLEKLREMIDAYLGDSTIHKSSYNLTQDDSENLLLGVVRATIGIAQYKHYLRIYQAGKIEALISSREYLLGLKEAKNLKGSIERIKSYILLKIRPILEKKRIFKSLEEVNSIIEDICSHKEDNQSQT